jgi:gliding motility-associated-like protein
MNGDYVYVANSASNTIAVISTAANAVVSSISLPANSYPYYMALSPVASDVLYVTNSGANTVSAINTTTNTITATIPVGTHPQGITVSADGSRLYVTNNGSANLSVINTATNTVVATIGVGSGPSGVAITPDGSQVYVINNNSNTVSIIGTASDAVNTTITVNGSPYATGNFIVPGGGCTGAPITFAFNINPASAIGTTGGPSALHTIYGTPSASTSFNVTGTNLNANVLITPPAGFEVSTDNVNFTGTVEIADGTGTINSTPVYIRLAAITPVGTYKGNIVLSSSGAANVNVAMPASTVTPAALTIKALDQSKAYGTPNPLFTFDITGFVNDESSANLTTQPTLSTTAVTNSPVGTYPITINGAADPNYTITFVNATLTVIPAALTITVVNQTKVYGAPMPTLTLSYTGFANGDTEASLTTKPTVTTAATASSPVGQYVMDVGGASDPNYSINYFQGTLTIIPASLTITANDQTKAFGAPNPVLTVSYSGFVNGDTEASLTPQPSVTTTATVLSPAGTYPITASGAADNNYTITYVTGTLTVTAQPPNIAGAGNLSPLNTVYGTPSTATIFTISGTGMTAGILVTPPAGFQVSANDANYSATVTVGGAGDITATTVYIRLAATTPVGDYSGNIVLSSSGAASFDLAMPSSTVSPASLTITANDKSKIYDTPNPALTVSYSGFVNNDGPGQLTTQPVVTTDALTTSPVGEYPITVSGAASPNYTITYVAGILTINPVPPHIVIPNTFTPNGDGINDTWNVKYLDLYPGCYVQIFTRYGQKVFSSTGYGTPWDGTYGGTTVTTGTYYYIIDLKNGSSPFSGWVAVIR